MSLGEIYLQSIVKRLLNYKELGDKTFAQLGEKDINYKPNSESNSIAIIVRHVSGNMLSRWTNFLTEDGEKDWRNRDTEFSEQDLSRTQLLDIWEKGWKCLLDTLRSLKEEDLLKTIYIRHQPLTAIDAINRQLTHYPHHIGQIVYIGKLIRNGSWTSLSIPKGQSQDYNKQMQGGK
ncbi:MAG TPA: DUF1572 family protein [Puia sp.]|nr:DUF1572 family protein [Puia sp.]